MEQRVKRGADSYKRAFKEALDNGSMSRRKLAWSEPWDWERAKQGVRAVNRAMTFGRKRVDILYGPDGNGRIPYDQVEFFSFERWQGQSVFVVKGVDKFKKLLSCGSSRQ